MDEISGFWTGAQRFGRQVDYEALAKIMGGWRNIEQASPSALQQVGVRPADSLAWSRCRPSKTLGRALTLASRHYPKSLRRTLRPPPVLLVEGDLNALDPVGIALVGTRRCTAYGRGVARQLGNACAAAGLTVVSGLARGIDAAAHRGAIASGRTIAVLGHGLAHTSPSSHRSLRADIVGSGGLLVSTWPDDVPPRPHTFPRRNQWIAGLSAAVVVIEAGERSGAKITARAALLEGRDVYAVPGPIGAPASVGCLQLIREGAGVVHDIKRFVEQWSSEAIPLWSDWLQRLFHGASLHDVATQRGCSVRELLAHLTDLELRGEVVRLPGQRYAPSRRPQ